MTVSFFCAMYETDSFERKVDERIGFTIARDVYKETWGHTYFVW